MKKLQNSRSTMLTKRYDQKQSASNSPQKHTKENGHNQDLEGVQLNFQYDDLQYRDEMLRNAQDQSKHLNDAIEK